MNYKDKLFLKNMKKLIEKRRYESCYLHNEYIGFGTSNIDDINVDYDAFFDFYSNEDKVIESTEQSYQKSYK